jgi:AraC-like DNA-binding protein
MSTTVFETHDADAAAQFLADMHTSSRLYVNAGNPAVRMEQTGLGGQATLFRATFTMRYTVQGSPLGVIPIGRVRTGTVTYRTGREGTDSKQSDVFIATFPDRDWYSAVDGADLDAAYLDPALLAEVADGQPQGGPALRFTGYRPISATAARTWSHTFDYVKTATETLPADTAPLLTNSLARLLAATALTVFPNTALTDPTIEDRHDAHPASLRRAIAFIDDNAHREISPADIAAAAHVTLRTVQLAFRRHLDTTPTAYLRRVRLHHAHGDLLAADPTTGATVTAIAARWGFANHSRFSAEYRAIYGITPSRTLRE